MTSTGSDSPLARYVVGIDLGTTNCALAYVDTTDVEQQVTTFAVPQLVAASTVDERDTLPSFHYERGAGELTGSALRLPWSAGDVNYCVGLLAREHGLAAPGRLVNSAKSWLCHAGVDRLADLLPWHGAADVTRLSPVEVSARYLSHLREAWNARFRAEPLEQQDVVITLPASFDEVARELTVKAAQRAGLPRVVLIEEPQAAFYAWLRRTGDAWEAQVRPGQKILVCDIGGGTSDFTLLAVRQQSDGQIQFQRIAVGEHLILGGDNLDLAIARYVERRLCGDGQLEPRAWAVLLHTARQTKETLLGPGAPERLSIHLPGSGSKLIGSGYRVEVTRDEIRSLLIDGFLPEVPLDARPLTRRSGFQEFGLPYAADAAITRYLAAFLAAHRETAIDRGATTSANLEHDPARPDLVLFNGGFFASAELRERLLQVLGTWFTRPGDTPYRPLVLENDRLDLAVARGAAYYGLVRRGIGVRIAAGLARSYYIGVGSGAATPSSVSRAMCVAPAGVEEGTTIELPGQQFRVLVQQPVEFPIYVSSTRLTDRPGDVIDVDSDQLTVLPPIRTVLSTSKKSEPAAALQVELHARLTELGSLELWLQQAGGARSWRLQFDVRAATQTDQRAHDGLAERAGVLDEATVSAGRALVAETFAPPVATSPAANPEALMKRLAEVLAAPRDAWEPTLLRELWETTLEVAAGRSRSAQHEARWLHLIGFALRPGYGLALDDWRVQQTWRVLQQKLVHGSPAVRAEWWILWRRLAGGLPAGQQRALADPLLAEIRAQHKPAKQRAVGFKPGSHEQAEMWRALGSFERLPLSMKEELGRCALESAARETTSSVRAAQVWALGRLGARQPAYAGLNATLAPEVAADWLAKLLDQRLAATTVPFALMQLARRTDDRYRDLPVTMRERVLGRLEQLGASDHWQRLVREGGELDEADEQLVFGESLPHGLHLL